MSDVAKEINRRFWARMIPGGEIDRILDGNDPVEKRPPLSDVEIALIKRQIEAQLEEYTIELNQAVGWFASWKRRVTRRGFRCMDSIDAK